MRSVLLALGFSIALGSAFAASAPRDTLIVPGQRVGPIALGMNAAELEASVGAPGTMRKEGSNTIYSWGEVSAEIDAKSGVVDLIAVNDERYETADHLHVGLAALAVVVVLGQPQNVTTPPGIRNYEYDGMTVVTRNAMVAQIRVQK